MFHFIEAIEAAGVAQGFDTVEAGVSRSTPCSALPNWRPPVTRPCNASGAGDFKGARPKLRSGCSSRTIWSVRSARPWMPRARRGRELAMAGLWTDRSPFDADQPATPRSQNAAASFPYPDVAARFFMQWQRVSFRNQLGQFILATTDWFGPAAISSGRSGPVRPRYRQPAAAWAVQT